MEQIIQITKDMTIQQAIAIFFNEDALRLPPDKIYRMDLGNYRYYYKFVEQPDGTMLPEFYQSVTTMIHNTMPTSKYLIDWYAQNGLDKARQILDESSTYGTFMHKVCADLLINGTIDLDTMDQQLSEFLYLEGMDQKYVKEWIHNLRKDVLAFAQFIIDTNFEPLAIEMVLVDDEHKYGGALDLVGYMDVKEKGFFGEVYKSGAKAGEQKETTRDVRVLALIDMKSGRKGFWESHEIQLEAYGRMWNKTFTDKKLERIFNWSPKDWRSTPSYNLKDQTNSPNREKLDYMLKIAAIEDAKKDRMVTITSGKIDLARIRKNPENLKANIQEVTLEQVVEMGEKKRNSASEPKEENVL